MAAPPPQPTTKLVRSGGDLRANLRGLPPGTVVVLDDSGPYRLGPPGPDDGPIPGDLTIRAALGVGRPTIVPGDVPEGADEPADGRPLLHFEGGRVVVEGIDFDLRDAPALGRPGDPRRAGRPDAPPLRRSTATAGTRPSS